MKALADIDLGPGDMAVLSGAALYIYGPAVEERLGPDGRIHIGDCAIHRGPPCDCGCGL